MEISNDVLVRVDTGDIVNGEFEVPPSIRKIDPDAFWGKQGLSVVKLPEGIDNIPGLLFAGRAQLTTLRLPQTLRSIESEALRGCAALTDITMPKGLNRIDARAFEYCQRLESIILPAGFNGRIAADAFKGCVRLRNIYVYAHDAVELERIRALLPDDMMVKEALFNDEDNEAYWEFEPESLTLETLGSVSLRDACRLYPFYEEVEGMRQQAFDKLCLEPKVNKAFSLRYKGILAELPDLALASISSLLGRDHRYYKRAEDEIRSERLPMDEAGFDRYQHGLSDITNKYTQMAQMQKSYPHERGVQDDVAEQKDDHDDGGPTL